MIQRCSDDFKFGMLVLHCGLHIPMPHRPHDSRQVSGSFENPRAIIVPAAIKNKVLGKSGFSSGFPEPVRRGREVSAGGPGAEIIIVLDASLPFI